MLAMKDLMISSTEGTPGSDMGSRAAAPSDIRSMLAAKFPHSILAVGFPHPILAAEFRLTMHGEIPFLDTGVIPLHSRYPRYPVIPLSCIRSLTLPIWGT